jgi:transcription elongation GreA/GreB family factor
MTDLATLKILIFQELKTQVQQKIAQAQVAVNAAIESRDGETKSSAGDKFETGRAMMQLEQQRHEVQLSKAFQLSADLDRLDMEATYSTVTPGALVKTDRGIYFMSIGMGKIRMDEATVYCISIQSPIGKMLLHQKENTSVEFQGKPLYLVKIV